MYKLAVRRDFIAQHALIGGDWGAENQPHSHHYVLELQMEGDTLDEHGFLVDIVDVEHALAGVVNGYRDFLLNDLPEFSGLNPSLENFSRIICISLNKNIRSFCNFGCAKEENVMLVVCTLQFHSKPVR